MPLIKVVILINKLPGIPEKSARKRQQTLANGERHIARRRRVQGRVLRPHRQTLGLHRDGKGGNWSCRLRRFPPQRHKGAQVLSRDGLHDVFRDGHRPYPSGVRRRWAALQQQRSRWRGRRGHSCPFDAAVALEGTRKPWGRSLPLHVAQRLRRERVDVST